MSKKTYGYKLDLANQTLTMTAAFEAAAAAGAGIRRAG